MLRATRLFRLNRPIVVPKNTRLFTPRLFTTQNSNLNSKPPITTTPNDLKAEKLKPITPQEAPKNLGASVIYHLDKSEFQRAFEILNSQDASTFFYNTFLFAKFLQAIAKTSHFPNYITKILEMMKQHNVAHDNYTIFPIVQGYHHMDNIEEVVNWEKTLRDLKIELDGYMYNALVSAYCTRSAHAGDVDRLVQEAIAADVGDGGMYISFIRAYAKMRQLAKVEEMIEISKQKGVELTADAYDKIIGVYGLSGELNKMRKYFTEMKRKNLEISKKTIGGMLVGYIVHGASNDALNLIKEMNNLGVPPSTSALNHFLRKFKALGELHHMRKVYDIMRANYVKPDHLSVFELIRYYTKLGDDENVKFFVKEMEEFKIKPGRIFSHILLRHAISKQNYEIFDNIVANLKASKETTDPEIFHLVLAGFHKFGKNDLALQFFHEMERKFAADGKTFQLLLEIYGSNQDLEKLNQVWAKYKQTTKNIDSYACDAMIKGLFNCDKKDEAKKVLMEDFKTDTALALVYRTFIRLYLKMVQQNKIERPDLNLIKAVKRVATSLEGLDKLDSNEVKKLETLINVL